MLTVLVLGSIAAGNCSAVNASPEYVKADVEGISYQGRDNYRVNITVYNRSHTTIGLKEYTGFFSVQTEILGSWRELRSSCANPTESTVLLPHKTLQVVCMVNIPLTIPALYTNSEGDINVLLKYRVRFHLLHAPGLRSAAGENSYWITPATDTWVLREGM